MPGRVIVVGSVNVDLVVTAPRLPSAGETVIGGPFARYHGGKGGNQAVASARLGAPTSLVGAVGDDAFGAEARAALAADGVDVAELATIPGEATGVALIVVGAGGDNQIAVASGANAAVTPEQVRQALARLRPVPDDVVLVGHEIPTTSAREALRLAREAGATAVLNPAPAGGLDRATFGLADVLTPNRGELAALVGAEDQRIGRPSSSFGDTARAARSLVEGNAEGSGVPAVLVSLGAGGALLVRVGEPPLEIPAPVVAAVDTTGAGDTLNGALAAGIASGLDLEAAARSAVLTASHSTAFPGARGAPPR